MSVKTELGSVNRNPGQARRLLVGWGIASLAAAAGLLLAYLRRNRLAPGQSGLIPVILGAILATGLLAWLAWRFSRSDAKTGVRRPEAVLMLNFVLTQSIAACLAAVSWLDLSLLSHGTPGKLQLAAWIIFDYLCVVLLFLFILGKSFFTGRWEAGRPASRRIFSLLSPGDALLLLTFASALLIGMAADGSILGYLERVHSPQAGLDLFAILAAALPWLVFDLMLACSVFVRLPGRIASSGWMVKAASFADTHPGIASLTVTLLYFILCLLIFRPGYETDDDIGIISIASGYLGGQPTPFLVFSNVVWGFLLKALYQLPTRINWEIWLFLFLNFVSVWALIHLFMTRPWSRGMRAMGVLTVLVVDAYFLLNINFTSMAAFASLAGLCLVVAVTRRDASFSPWQAGLGIFMVLAGSLIRIESSLIVLALLLPAVILLFKSFHLRRLILSLGILVALVAGGYLFDRLYVSSFPDWAAFNTYNLTRSMLHDTPRLANMGGTIREVGWSENDLVMFTHWFFPDPAVYSLQNLEYLVAHVPDTRPSLPGIAATFFHQLLSLASIPYLLAILLTWLAGFYSIRWKRVAPPLFVLLILFTLLSLYLSWTQKLPYRVLLPLLGCIAIFEFFVFIAPAREQDIANAGSTASGPLASLRTIGIGLSLAAALGIVLLQAADTSRSNTVKQSAYRGILSDLQTLRNDGKIQADALILSPAVGIPLEWSNPMVLDFPAIRFMSMGWLTYSPPYQAVLRQYGVASLPAGLYQNDRVYLMERSNIMYGILNFIREHERVEVKGEALYAMPNVSGDDTYADVHLYKIVQLNNPGQ